VAGLGKYVKTTQNHGKKRPPGQQGGNHRTRVSWARYYSPWKPRVILAGVLDVRMVSGRQADHRK